MINKIQILIQYWNDFLLLLFPAKYCTPINNNSLLIGNKNWVKKKTDFHINLALLHHTKIYWYFIVSTNEKFIINNLWINYVEKIQLIHNMYIAFYH